MIMKDAEIDDEGAPELLLDDMLRDLKLDELLEVDGCFTCLLDMFWYTALLLAHLN